MLTPEVKQVKKFLILSVCVLLLITLVPILPTAQDRAIYDQTVRLHVIANSDTDEDQRFKLQVRDGVLAYLGPLMEQVTDREEAEQVIAAHMDEIRAAAQAVVARAGREDAVSVAFDREYYPRKEYEGVTLPAGNYLSLQIMLGEHAGANWWCVLFPTLCTTTARPEQELTRAGFTVGQVRLITDNKSTKYKLKFRLLELLTGGE